MLADQPPDPDQHCEDRGDKGSVAELLVLDDGDGACKEGRPGHPHPLPPARHHQPPLLYEPQKRNARQDLHAIQCFHAVVTGTYVRTPTRMYERSRQTEIIPTCLDCRFKLPFTCRSALDS